MAKDNLCNLINWKCIIEKKITFFLKKKKRFSNIIHLFKGSRLHVHIAGFTDILRWLVLCCFDSARAYFVHIEMSPLPVKFNPRLLGGGVFNVLWPRTSVCWLFLMTRQLVDNKVLITYSNPHPYKGFLDWREINLWSIFNKMSNKISVIFIPQRA